MYKRQECECTEEEYNEAVKVYEQRLADFGKRYLESGGKPCLLYTSPSPRDRTRSRMPSPA